MFYLADLSTVFGFLQKMLISDAETTNLQMILMWAVSGVEVQLLLFPVQCLSIGGKRNVRPST